MQVKASDFITAPDDSSHLLINYLLLSGEKNEQKRTQDQRRGLQLHGDSREDEWGVKGEGCWVL